MPDRQGLARGAMARLMGRRLPVVDGIRVVDGPAAPVTIRRDANHVPHIEAQDDHDAWFGLGYAVGQDRGWQVTSYQRVVRGTLAAMIGKDGLPVDRFARRIGFHHRAGLVLAAQDEATSRSLEAYARGVTAGMAQGSSARPHELALLRTDVQPVTAQDVVGVMLLFAFSLAANWDAELARLQVLVEDGPDALRAVSPAPAAHLPVTWPVGSRLGEVIDHLEADLDIVGGLIPLEGASNNWALSAARTATGSVLLANDPHLTCATPAHWYLAHVSTPSWSVAGATLVGAPSVVAGHNGHAAWGVTAGRTDSTDLFLEQVDGTRVRDDEAPGGWVEATVRREVIEVRGQRTHHVEDVLEGPRGPIIGPAIKGAPDAISMAATWWDARPVSGFLDLVRARSFDDVRKAFVGWPMHLNLVWGDQDGHIGWHLLGTLPRRRSGNGTVPLPGWLADVGWEDGRIDIPGLPWALDPPGGLLATANNPPVVPTGGPFLGVDFADAYRLQAITRTLDARDDWTVATLLEVQRQTRTHPWDELREHLLAVDPGPDEDVRLAQDLLASWDGDVTGASVAASVYELALANLTVGLVRARAPRSARAMLDASFTPLAEHGFMALQRTAQAVRVLRGELPGWDDAGSILHGALGDAVRRLREEHGSAPDRWSWGRVRPVRLRHSLASAIPALGPVFDVPIPTGGDTHTISPQTVVPTEPLGNPLAIANLRMVVDLGDVEASRFALAGGQSGNPCSPHYDDLVGPWLGGGIPIPFAPAEVERSARHTLRLVPTTQG